MRASSEGTGRYHHSLGSGWVVVAELTCFVGFILALLSGRMGIALAILVVPFQVLLWVVLGGDAYRQLVLLVFLLPLAGVQLLPNDYSRFILYPSIIVFIAVNRLAERVDRYGGPRMEVPLSDRIPLVLLAAWVVAAGVNATVRGWTSDQLQFYSVLALEVLAVLYFFATVPRTLGQVSRLLHVIAAMTVAAVLSLLFLPGSVGEGGALGGKSVVTPFGLANLNAFGTFLCSISVVLIGMVLDERRLKAKLLLAAAVVLMTAALLLTKSRGAWLGFGIACVYVLLRARSPRFTAAAAASALLLLSLDSSRHVLFTRVGETTSADPSLTGRLLLWTYALKIAKANPVFGVGMENFRYVKQFFGYPLKGSYQLVFNAHNLYLELLVDLGAVGLASFLWILANGFIRLDRLARCRGAKGRGLATGLAAGIIAYSVHGLMDALTWQHGAFMLLGVLLGLSICVIRLGAETSPSDDPAHRILRSRGPIRRTWASGA